jgi:hypothetical protein
MMDKPMEKGVHYFSQCCRRCKVQRSQREESGFKQRELIEAVLMIK